MATTARTRELLRPRAALVAEELDYREAERADNGRWRRMAREDMAERVAAIEADHLARTGRAIGRKLAEAMAYYDRVLDEEKQQRESMERWQKRFAELRQQEGQD